MCMHSHACSYNTCNVPSGTESADMWVMQQILLSTWQRDAGVFLADYSKLCNGC